jgi:Ser/Thr protein kinase RdoA (MazF antagonist)
MEKMYFRSGTDSLPGHLAARYGIRIAQTTELDLGVFRVDRLDGPSWVARVFPSERPLESVEGDARILRLLADDGFPAERCAVPDAVSVHEDQGVLVTELVEGAPADDDEPTFAMLGELLGRLHSLPAEQVEGSRDGGAWHHLSLSGGPREEIAAAMSLLEDARSRVPSGQEALYEALQIEIGRGDDFGDLPRALVHPDFVPANAIASSRGGLVLVDWAGAGRGPRLSSLGFLLWAAGARDLRYVDAVVGRYCAHVRIEPEEWARLGAAVGARPVVFGCWAFCTGRRRLADVVDELPATRRLTEAIAARAARSRQDRIGGRGVLGG